MEEIRSWWEVPSIAHFCSLFRAAFDLSDFDIEELEDALLASGSEEGSPFLTDLFCSLLKGCYRRKDVHWENWEFYLKDLIKRRWGTKEERRNPLENEDFRSLSLRDKVEVLHAVCDYRLDANDVADLLKGLDGDNLRVEPLGVDKANNTYWYFYGTRLYREDPEPPGQSKKTGKGKKMKARRKRRKDKRGSGRRRNKGKNWAKKKKVVEESDSIDDMPLSVAACLQKEAAVPVIRWHLICSTLEDWQNVAESFKESKVKCERDFHRAIIEDFLPEIPKIMEAKERKMRKKLMEMAPRRISSRLETKREKREKEDETMSTFLGDDNDADDSDGREECRQICDLQRREEQRLQREERAKAKEERARRERLIEEKDVILDQKRQDFHHGLDLKSEFDEDAVTGMYKVLEAVKNHQDAWPFWEPVNESFAPGYYTIIKNPMDLSKIEKKINDEEYWWRSQFMDDFRLMIDNCLKYNGPVSEYSVMAKNIEKIFKRAMEKYLPEEDFDSSDDFFCRPNTTTRKLRPKRAAHSKAAEALQMNFDDGLSSCSRSDSPVSTGSSCDGFVGTEKSKNRHSLDNGDSDDQYQTPGGSQSKLLRAIIACKRKESLDQIPTVIMKHNQSLQKLAKRSDLDRSEFLSDRNVSRSLPAKNTLFVNQSSQQESFKPLLASTHSPTSPMTVKKEKSVADGNAFERAGCVSKIIVTSKPVTMETVAAAIRSSPQVASNLQTLIHHRLKVPDQGMDLKTGLLVSSAQQPAASVSSGNILVCDKSPGVYSVIRASKPATTFPNLSEFPASATFRIKQEKDLVDVSHASTSAPEGKVSTVQKSLKTLHSIKSSPVVNSKVSITVPIPHLVQKPSPSLNSGTDQKSGFILKNPQYSVTQIKPGSAKTILQSPTVPRQQVIVLRPGTQPTAAGSSVGNQLLHQQPTSVSQVLPQPVLSTAAMVVNPLMTTVGNQSELPTRVSSDKLTSQQSNELKPCGQICSQTGNIGTQLVKTISSSSPDGAQLAKKFSSPAETAISKYSNESAISKQHENATARSQSVISAPVSLVCSSTSPKVSIMTNCDPPFSTTGRSLLRNQPPKKRKIFGELHGDKISAKIWRPGLEVTDETTKNRSATGTALVCSQSDQYTAGCRDSSGIWDKGCTGKLESASVINRTAAISDPLKKVEQIKSEKKDRLTDLQSDRYEKALCGEINFPKDVGKSRDSCITNSLTFKNDSSNEKLHISNKKLVLNRPLGQSLLNRSHKLVGEDCKMVSKQNSSTSISKVVDRARVKLEEDNDRPLDLHQSVAPRDLEKKNSQSAMHKLPVNSDMPVSSALTSCPLNPVQMVSVAPGHPLYHHYILQQQQLNMRKFPSPQLVYQHLMVQAPETSSVPSQFAELNRTVDGRLLQPAITAAPLASPPQMMLPHYLSVFPNGTLSQPHSNTGDNMQRQ